MAKIYVRERSSVGKGAGRPRFEIVAVSGIDLKVYHSHVRRAELEQIAEDLQAEVVYLARGEQAGEEAGGRRGRRGRRRGGGHAEQEA